MNIRFRYYPGGRKRALTMSYDDGTAHDRRLVGIFNRYGVKGSFHLNSGALGREGYVHAGEVAELYRGHEVSAHSVTHPFLTMLPSGTLAEEITDDRRGLEALCGYPVRGMSYPFGAFNDEVVRLLPQLGVEYARTTLSHGKFQMPDDFLRWHPTCHHNGNLMERLNEFRNLRDWYPMPLFYVWGHSYEFQNDDNWNMIEEFCERASNDADAWYATNIEIVDYMNALRRLKFSVDGAHVINPSAIPVWIDADGEAVEIKPGTQIYR